MGSTPSSPKSNNDSPPPVDLQRTNNLRTSLRTRIPMPSDQTELERRFTKVLASMDLPPDKAKLLKQYDNEKKWDLICDQERVQAKETPAYYLNKLRTYLDPKASRSSRKRKIVGDATSTQVLRDLEISLRTNHIEWVREFLNQENRGLDSLVDYLSFRLIMMRHELVSSKQPLDDTIIHNVWSGGKEDSVCGVGNMDSLRRRSRHAARLRMGDTKDDIHLCIMSLRAIMNNKYGFNMVIQHTEAINCIALSLIHKSLRTKALVLELLAAICLVKGGHKIILAAFDNFKELCQEKRRFQTLMQFFINYEIFHIEFIVACMQFVNVIVHSVDDMNYRVHLQYEFTKLGLDEYLDKLRRTESEELQVQISAYLDNVFDVAALMEDSETKTSALEKVAELEDELSHTVEKLGEVERESMRRVASLEQALAAARQEREQLVEGKRIAETEVATLRRVVQRNSVLNDLPPPPPPDSCSSSGVSSCSEGGSSGGTPPPPPPPPPPVAAPPPPPPPPSARLTQDQLQAMTIKRKVQTKYKLPTLNWIALKPNQVRGTIFNELDDEKLHTVIDFTEFEEKFKLCGGGGRALSETDMSDGLSSFPSKRFKKPDNISLLEHARLRNIAISRRKIDMPIEKLICAVNTFDLKVIPLESVELLSKMVPNEAEVKSYREYVSDKKDINLLTEEDKFMLQLTKVERLSSKLSIMTYIGNFHDNVHLITPQVQAVLSASKSVRNSKKLLGVLEVVLVFGNYLNSSKRGPAYGFKLQSLDTLLETKSNDKKFSLLHYIVETVQIKLPNLMNFDSELMYIDKASLVSMENVLLDIVELEKGMDVVRRESEGRKDRVLRDFLANSEERLRRLRLEVKAAHEALGSCLEYFGESLKGTDANTFFLLLVRFVKAFKLAEQENDQRKRLEAAARQALNNNNDETKNKFNKLTNHKRQQNLKPVPVDSLPKGLQDAVINELKNKTRMVQEKKLLHQDEVYNGALEDILLGLRSEPYRRADAVRRSQRRRIDSNRLSRTFEEIDV